MPEDLLGKKIRILALPDDPAEELYIGKEGIITSYNYDCDKKLRYWGTWGGIAIYPDHDGFEVIGDVKDEH